MNSMNSMNCIQAINTGQVGDLNILEKVQRRCTKMINGFKNLPYEDRLKRLHFYPMHYRSIRRDLILTFNLFQSNQILDYFSLPLVNQLRGHSRKLYKERPNTTLRLRTFSYRVVNIWNKLPDNVVNAPSVEAFKSRLDKVLPSLLGLEAV